MRDDTDIGNVNYCSPFNEFRLVIISSEKDSNVTSLGIDNILTNGGIMAEISYFIINKDSAGLFIKSKAQDDFLSL